MIEFQQVAGILCPMKLMKNIRNGATCYHDLLTDKYYAFLGITSDRKVEFETRETLQKGVENSRNEELEYCIK
jgi:hypothetical protein